MRQLMVAHEKLGLLSVLLFTAILGWKLWRREQRGRREEAILRIVSVVGMVGVMWTVVLAQHMVFDHAAGIDSAAIQAELLERRPQPHMR